MVNQRIQATMAGCFAYCSFVPLVRSEEFDADVQPFAVPQLILV